MKPRDLFGLAVRITGLACLVYFLANMVMFGVGLPWFFILRSIVWLLVSIWFIRGAPQLVRFAYPDE